MTNTNDSKRNSLKLHLKNARTRLQQMGIPPRFIGVILENQALLWIYKNGFSTPTIIQRLLNKTSGGYLPRLERKGLLTKTYTQTGQQYYTLSQDGLSQVESQLKELLHYPEINPYRVNQLQFKHSLLCQTLTLQALKNQQILKFESEREIRKKGLLKQPDCIWLSVDEKYIGVEVELTQKWDRDRDEFIRKIWLTLQNVENNDFVLDEFIIFSNSNAILENYKRAFSPGSSLPIWKKNERGHWAIVMRVEVPEWLIEKVSFRFIRNERSRKSKTIN